MAGEESCHWGACSPECSSTWWKAEPGPSLLPQAPATQARPHRLGWEEFRAHSGNMALIPTHSKHLAWKLAVAWEHPARSPGWVAAGGAWLSLTHKSAPQWNHHHCISTPWPAKPGGQYASTHGRMQCTQASSQARDRPGATLGSPPCSLRVYTESWGITVNNRPAHSPVAGLLHHRCGAVSLPHPAHRGYGSSSAQGPSPISTQVGSAQAQQLLYQGHSCSSLPPSGKKCATDGTRCYGSSDIVVRLAPCLP